MNNKNLWLTAFLSFVVFGLMAHTPDLGKRPAGGNKPVVSRGFCASSESQIDQEINNVRARLLGGGDCWWDFNDGRYIVPKVDPTSGQREVSSIFAASVWLGGLDPAGNLKLAAQDYRTGGRNDFWPGPLDPLTGTTTAETCKNWDKHFRVTGDEIRQHLANLAAGITDPNSVPRGVKGWPARGNPYFIDVHQFSLPNTQQGLALFFDADGDDNYDPLKGDYPSIEVRGCDLSRYPSEMIFWIYNDEGAGSNHGVTQGKPIQMEVQVQSFGYQTSDELNDMTFQRYKLINRATDFIDSTFFAMWVDADLGCFADDYIGCDTLNSLMYTYNQDAVDGSSGCNCPSGNSEVPTYCTDVPILGVDYFRGPLRPAQIIDWENPTGPLKDTLLEIGMSSFMYYNNPGVGTPLAPTTDPSLPAEFYNYLTGTWRDGTPLTEGGSGYSPGSTQKTKYALPSSPDDEQGWSMCTSTLPFGDRRTLQASGPFRLAPGAVNELIIGVPWVPSIKYPCPDVELLLRADKLAQGLFDNCFERLEGPDAPTVDWIELNKQLVAVLSNESVVSNNQNEEYEQYDFLAPNDIRFNADPAIRETAKYKFEGYKVYQLINPNVSVREFDANPDVSRLVAQVDKKNGVARIFNWLEAPDPTAPNDPKKKVYYPEEQVTGADAGIRHTFAFKDDQFSTSNIRTLVNHKKYYYAVVAYAHNNYTFFNQAEDGKTSGQQSPYLEGGRVEIKTVIPRPTIDQSLNAAYGDGVDISRLEGEGAGGVFLDVKDESREAMLSSGFNGQVDYKSGSGPINITIFNPFEVKDGDFELEFFDSNVTDGTLDADAKWALHHLDADGNIIATESDTSDVGINDINEQIFAQYGFSVSIAQTAEVGNLTPALRDAAIINPGKTNGGIGADWVYTDPNKTWLDGISDQAEGLFNFVRTGKTDPDYLIDPEGQLSQLGNGVFVPYAIASGELLEGADGRMITPAWTGKVGGSYYNRTAMGSLDPAANNNSYQRLNLTPNVDIVLTSDQSKWSRCVVVETASEYFTGVVPGVVKDPALVTEGSVASRPRQSFDTRLSPSVGKTDSNGDGLPDPDSGLVEPDSLPDPTATNPNNKRANPIKGQPLTGMGWFPGYAVNVETGQRLNIFFGENSAYSKTVNAAYTGRDMMWNPTSQFLRDENNVTEVFDFIMGGHHWMYVANTPYDGCEYLRARLNPDYWSSALKNLRKREAIAQIAWAGMTYMNPDSELKALKDGLIPNDMVIKLRVDNPYQVRKNTGNGHPKYRFNITGRQSQPLTEVQVDKALDSVKVVPNPYYGFSEYEISSTSNVVKITNAPPKCAVTIYSLDGKFIRQYKRDETYTAYKQITPAIEWDMKNSKGIPVASGVYLIHINAYELGERTIKWFGVPRQFDPSGL